MVTATLLAPAVPAGVTAVMVVVEVTFSAVAATPPTVTLVVPATKFVPVIEINVPPRVEPLDGLTDVIVGGTTYVNAFVNVAVPPAVVTATLFAPAVPAGVTAVMVVVEVTFSAVASTPSTVTLVAPATKFVPVIVIAVPPRVEPDVGATDVIVGSTT